MRRVVRTLLWIAGSLVGVALVAVVVLVVLIRRPFPDVRGTHDVEGLAQPVEILRDERGVPHIWASTPEDLAFAHGYVHAQDRFFQMEINRRLAAGRLSELFGDLALPMDREHRTLGFTRIAAEEYELITGEERVWLDAYVDGVNAYISARRPRELGIEFRLIALIGAEAEIEPWTAVDSLSWAKIMASFLSDGTGVELGGIVTQRLGGLLLRDATRPPFRDGFPYTVTMEEANALRGELGLPPLEPRTATANDAASRRARSSSAVLGSNAWVLHGSRTTTGSPLLANDMHLGVQIPSIWYEVGLHLRPPGAPATGDPGDADASSLRLRGYSFPGVPGIVAGQNGSIAWALTNTHADARDYHLVRMDPSAADTYLLDGEPRAMDVRYEYIDVLGRDEPALHRVRHTVFGPIATDALEMDRWFTYAVTRDGAAPRLTTHELALEWSALEPETLFSAIYRLNRARDWAEFRAAAALWGTPGQNLLYADRSGTIAYQTTGRYLDRPPEDGALPVTDRTAPLPAIPFDELPASRNPEKGYIVSANHPIVPPEHPRPLGVDYSPGFRAFRIVELIESSGQLSVDSIAAMHADTQSWVAARVVPAVVALEPDEAVDEWLASRRFLEAMGGSDDADPEEIDERAERARELVPAAMALLDAWDFAMDADAAGPLIYTELLERLERHTFRDELPSHRERIVGGVSLAGTFAGLIAEPDHPYWDDWTTPDTEGAGEILARAFVDALLTLARTYGDEPEAWEWGKAHQITFRSQTLGSSGIGPVERLINRGPFPLGGSPDAVNVAHASPVPGMARYDVAAIPSQRCIYDLADPSASRFVHAPGQSGHPMHRNYDDLIAPWRDVSYHRANWSYAEAREAAGRRVLVLE
jgi:penicillin amidase